MIDRYLVQIWSLFAVVMTTYVSCDCFQTVWCDLFCVPLIMHFCEKETRWNLFVFVMPYTGCIIENFLLMLCLKSKKMKLCSYIRHFQTIIFNLFSFVSLFQMEITPAWCGIIFLLSILSFLYECGYYFSIESPPKTWNILHTSYSYVLHFSLFLVVVIFSSNFYL